MMLVLILRLIGLLCRGHHAVALENLALRQQVAVLTRISKRPQVRTMDRLFWVCLASRVLAFTELKFSNSMIEAWWRSLKHQWLFLHSLDSVTTVRRLVEF